MEEPLRVFVLANDDPTSNHIFRGVLEAGEGVRLIGIAYSRTLTRGKARCAGTAYLFTKMDIRYWLYLVFWNGIFSLGEFLQDRIVSPSHMWSLKPICARINIPVFYSADFNSRAFMLKIRALSPDLIITRANQILRGELLEIPQFGVWCCHSSLLPSYQGVAAEFHGLRRREERIGTTIFQVEERLDEGPNLFQVSIPVKRKESVYAHTIRNNEAARRLLTSSLVTLARTRRRPEMVPEDPALEKSYHSWPAPQTVRDLRRGGHGLISMKEVFVHMRRCFLGFKEAFQCQEGNRAAGERKESSKGSPRLVKN
jgi:folate-dependent phosphoribosylglycinamide formyltransferase PurN